MKKIFQIILLTIIIEALTAQTSEQVKQAKQFAKRAGMTENQVKSAAKKRGFSEQEINKAIQKEQKMQATKRVLKKIRV